MLNFNAQLASIIDDLSENGYAVCEDFLPATTIKALADNAQDYYLNNKMSAAKTGKNALAHNADVRADCIYWLSEDDLNPDTKAYFAQMHALKQALNIQLLMNVHEFETHFAVYPVNGFYQKHLDQFNAGVGLQSRQLSSILYLNADWKASNGGALRLYLNADSSIDVLPNAGRLVVFLSNTFWHEVLPANRERLSLTGWFKTRSNQLL